MRYASQRSVRPAQVTCSPRIRFIKTCIIAARAGHLRPYDHWLGDGLTADFDSYARATRLPHPQATELAVATGPPLPNGHVEVGVAGTPPSEPSAPAAHPVVLSAFRRLLRPRPARVFMPWVGSSIAPRVHFDALSLQAAFLDNAEVRGVPCRSVRRWGRHRSHVPRRRLADSMWQHARVRTFRS